MRHQMFRVALAALAAGVILGHGPAFAAGDAAKGKAAFESCAVCHSPDSDEKKVGPGLKDLYKKDKMANGKKPTDASVRAKIDEGGGGMPPYKDMLSEPEKDDLIAYLKTL